MDRDSLTQEVRNDVQRIGVTDNAKRRSVTVYSSRRSDVRRMEDVALHSLGTNTGVIYREKTIRSLMECRN